MLVHPKTTAHPLLFDIDHAGLITRRVGTEFRAEPVPGPMQARLHAAERDAGTGGDLTVAEPLEVGKIDDDPVPVRQFPQCRDHIGIQQAPDHLVFGRAIV
jgi:hypothetical protein